MLIERLELGKLTIDPLATQDKSHSRNFHFYENLTYIAEVTDFKHGSK